MKWIKATERLPEAENIIDQLHLKIHNQPSFKSTGFYHFKKKVFVDLIDNRDWPIFQVEWLDESESPDPQQDRQLPSCKNCNGSYERCVCGKYEPRYVVDRSLDERAEKHVNDFILPILPDEVYSITRKELRDRLLNAYKAGANSSQHVGDALSTHEILKLSDQILTDIKKDKNNITNLLTDSEITSYNTGFHTGFCRGYSHKSTPIPPLFLDKLKAANPYRAEYGNPKPLKSIIWDECVGMAETILRSKGKEEGK